MDRENCHMVLLWVCRLGQSLRLSRSIAKTLFLAFSTRISLHLARVPQSQAFGDKTSSVSGPGLCPGCHPERRSRSPEPFASLKGKLREGEGSLRPSSQTLREARGDRHYLQISAPEPGSWTRAFHLPGKSDISP